MEGRGVVCHDGGSRRTAATALSVATQDGRDDWGERGGRGERERGERERERREGKRERERERERERIERERVCV